MGPVLIPNRTDAQGDRISADEIEKTAHDFMMKSQMLGTDHEQTNFAVRVVESFVAKSGFTMNGKAITKGTWVIVAKVGDTDVWQRVKNGELNGFSIEGFSQSEAAA